MSITLKFTVEKEVKIVFTKKDINDVLVGISKAKQELSKGNEVGLEVENLLKIYDEKGLEETIKVMTRSHVREGLRNILKDETIKSSPAKVTFHD